MDTVVGGDFSESLLRS